MNQNEGYKIVDFETYCATCKFQDSDEEDKPCRFCLDEPTNLYSEKPTQWKEKD